MSAPGRGLVWVADDLGVSSGTNAGIAQTAATVREASLCVTGNAVEAGAAQAQSLGLGVGLHLSFTLGRSLTGPLRGLTDAHGQFLDLRAVLFACLLRRPDRDQVAREVDAQLRRLRELVAAPSHVNGHHHVHVFPVIRDVVFAAASRCGIGWTRMPVEHAAAGGRLRPDRLLLARLAMRAAPHARAAGMRWLPFVGLRTENRADFARRRQRIAARLPAGTYEWMVHPRLPDEDFAALDPRGADRDVAAAAEVAAFGASCAEAVGRRFAEL
ncbi:MAG TPA: ChbG/HpnK family deacetylase [Planctomycetota bacterium]|nr:ChbG/HpnK family deacetylase [Planctomycetota bacterium]